jgi:hypothetical protein
MTLKFIISKFQKSRIRSTYPAPTNSTPTGGLSTMHTFVNKTKMSKLKTQIQESQQSQEHTMSITATLMSEDSESMDDQCHTYRKELISFSIIWNS